MILPAINGHCLPSTSLPATLGSGEPVGRLGALGRCMVAQGSGQGERGQGEATGATSGPVGAGSGPATGGRWERNPAISTHQQ